MLIMFIRHGQSETNAGLPSGAPRDVPLTPLGRRQAEAASALFPDAPPLTVVSPYIRTRQTAEPLLERHPDTEVQEWPIQEFTYLAPHKYLGTTLAERMPNVDAYWEAAEPDYRDGEGAETFREFIARVDAALERLARLKLPYALPVFCHGHFMRGVIWRILTGPQPIDARSMWRFGHVRHGLSIPNCAVLPLHRRSDGRLEVSTLRVGHLPPEDRTC